MNNYTAVVNLTADPEVINLGGKDIAKLRVADNTWGKNAEPRYFDVLLGQQKDMETAARLEKGDEVVITGTLRVVSYTAKQNTKRAKKGQKVFADEMPFGSIMKVTRSKKFFGGGEDADGESEDNTDAPDLGDDAGDTSNPADNPLGDILD